MPCRGALVVGLCLAGCAGAPAQPDEPKLDRLAPTHLYPLAEGNVWNYDAYSNLRKGRSLAQHRVVSVKGKRVEIQTNRGAPEVYEIRDRGIYHPSGQWWVLKAPIRKGAEWKARSRRRARVLSVRASVDTPAGSFDGCVRVEERGGGAGLRLETVYCPGVGPVYFDARMKARTTGREAREWAELRGYNLAD